MKSAFPILLMLAAWACGRPPSFELYEDASGFSAEIPSGWTRLGDADLTRRPVAVATWVGQVIAEDEGRPIGVVLNVTRISRKRSDLQKGRDWSRYKADWLDRSDALFAKSGGDTASFQQGFMLQNKTHGLPPTAMRLEDFVIRTNDAYWVLDYRATVALFEKHHPTFARLKASFKPGA
jgi:hypothetical protein